MAENHHLVTVPFDYVDDVTSKSGLIGNSANKQVVCGGCVHHALDQEGGWIPPITPENKNILLANSLQTRILGNEDCSVSQFNLMRVNWMQAMIDPRRNLDAECGYPPVIIPKQYRFMYDRVGVATRVVNIYPDECWAVDPEIYENEKKGFTPFEQGWQDLVESEETNPLHYAHRADILSGIGRYGALLLGLSDGLDLSQPVPGISVTGPIQPISKPLKLIYLRPFDESLCHVINYERDPSNPRFGQPLYYHMLFADVRVGEPGMTTAAVGVTSRVVHWSRVIHIADNRENSNVFGTPRQQPVFNNLCDVRKILAGSAEMFWKGGFPGYAFELLPGLVTQGVTLDQKSLKETLDRYADGLDRYLALVGLQAKSLAPQVADPKGNLDAQLGTIAITLGVPHRIFTGSEQAQLASGQDVRTWNRRLTRRMNKYISPLILRPLINRLIAFGVIPSPGKRYHIEWPDINMPSEDDKSKISDRILTGLSKYITGGVYQMLTPYDLLTGIFGIPADKASEFIKNAIAKGSDVPVIVPPAVMQAEVKPAGSDGGFGN